MPAATLPSRIGGMLVAVALAHSAGAAAAQPWTRVKSQDGIDVFSRPVAGSPIHAVRGVMRVDSSLTALVALLRDYQARPRWDSLCAESRLQRSISQTEELVYLHDDLPWPVADRDMLMRVQWSQDPVSLAVTMQARAVDGDVPIVPGRIRLTEVVNSWVLTPLGDGTIEVSTQAHLDPAGPLPSWLINRLAVDSPYSALRNIRELATEEQYVRAEVAFLRDTSLKDARANKN